MAKKKAKPKSSKKDSPPKRTDNTSIRIWLRDWLRAELSRREEEAAGAVLANVTYTVRGLARAIGRSERTIDRMFDNGLPYAGKLGTRLVSGRQFLEWVESTSTTRTKQRI